MKNYMYFIHEIGLQLITDSSALASAVEMLLCYFQRETLDERLALKFVFKEVRNRSQIPIIVSPYSEIISSIINPEWRCNFYRFMSLKIADLNEHGIMLIDHQQGRVEGYLVEPDVRHPEVLASFFYLALTELIKVEGLYTIHAASLVKEGHGFLIPGSSGSGKTTCCISLLRAGYQYISDDNLLLRANDVGCEMLHFPVRLDNRIALELFFKQAHNQTGVATIDVTKKTIEIFPELSATKGYPYQRVDKRYFFVEELYPKALAYSCVCKFIIFPRIIDHSKSYLEPLPKSRALEELLPQGFLVFDKETAKRQFQAFSHLVEKTDCYRLHFGEDILELPKIFDSLLAKI